jgi:hypothetical protein
VGMLPRMTVPATRKRRGRAPGGTAADKTRTLRHRQGAPGVTADEALAHVAVKGVVHNAVATVQFSQSPLN